MILATLLDAYELYTRRVQQLVNNGEPFSQEFFQTSARKREIRLEIEKMFLDLENRVKP